LASLVELHLHVTFLLLFVGISNDGFSAGELV